MASLNEHPFALTIWGQLKVHLKNEIGVAALMGNLQAESGLYPDRVQGDIPYSDYSKTYTANVDNGSISENDFVNNGPNRGGYGLAQWTFYTRKQGLYNMFKSGGYDSIGSPKLACDYLIYELRESYTGVYNALVNATDVRSASDRVLHDFENPADQSESVEILRASMGQEIYNTFKGLNGDNGAVTPTHKTMSKLLLWAIATDIY